MIFVLLKSRGIGPEAVRIICVFEPSAFVTVYSSGSTSESELFAPSPLFDLFSVFDCSSSPSESEESILIPSLILRLVAIF